VVLATSFRGDVGYSEPLARLTRASQVVSDLVASGRYLGGLGSVDPRRIGIVGESAGGMWTALTVGSSRSPFAAAVDFFGPTDLAELYRTVPPTRPRFDALFGPLGEKEAAYREASPITYASEMPVPLLVLHGAGDQTVPFDQSVRFIEALRAAGKDVQFEKLEGGHGFRDEEEARAYETVAAFLAERLK
jgi:dipeptidyl aminopeptidase/acylaminoacyl peptidase